MSRIAAACFHAAAGAVWLVVLLAAAWLTGGRNVGVAWFVCAGVLWLVALRRIRTHTGGSPWAQSFLWWLSSLVAPAALAGFLFGRWVDARAAAAHLDDDTEVVMNVDSFLLRLDDVDRRLRSLQREVGELRAEAVASARPAPPPPAAEPPRLAAPAPPPRREKPLPPRPEEPPRPRRELSLPDLLGARTLAAAGGVVTLLGVVFFFVLAVNRGWIGPGARVALGAGASALVFAGGLWLRRRFGETHSALAAVGAGIAGAYATLLAATALYDLVPRPLALTLAAAVAAVGTAVALAWEAELVAALGLLGALVVPALVAVQDGRFSTVGTAFAAVVTAAAGIVGVRLRWGRLLLGAAAASAPQVALLVAQAHRVDAAVAALAAVFSLVYLAVGSARQLGVKTGLDGTATSFVLGGGGLALLTAERLFGAHAGGVAAGLWLAGVAVAYGAVAILLRTRRELTTLVGGVALTLAAVGVADALSGATVTFAWAAEAALLAFLASRVREPRLRLGALAYLLLAAGHAVGFEAAPEHLFVALAHPAAGAPALAAVALAALLFGAFARPHEDEPESVGLLRPLAVAAAALVRHAALVRGLSFAAAAVAATYAASLGLLALFQLLDASGGIGGAFQDGHAAVAALWAAAGLASVLLGARRRAPAVVTAGFAWLGVTVVEVLGFDATHLAATPRGLAFLAVAAALLAAGYRIELAAAGSLVPAAAAATLIALGLAVGAALPLVGEQWRGLDAFGAALLAVAVTAGTLAVPILRRRRDASTLLWTAALALAAVAAARLVGGVWLVLAWSAGAAALAWLGAVGRERRLHLASLAYLAAGAGAALVLEAPPADLLVAHAHPGAGVPSLLLVVAAAAALALHVEEERRRAAAWWSASLVGVYAVSLAILEAAERLSPASLQTDFQRGHTAVSALWGLLGLGLLYAGLTRGRRALRLGGFGLFGLSLAKLFLYDLGRLSSVTRALSFLAVGAVLLLGGFFYQRLSSGLDERRERPPREPLAGGLRS